MYAPQSNIPSATKYFLDALNTGEAQLKTADGADTVFAQKMQQGIAQGVPQTQGMQGAKQDYAAAQPSMMRNMQQQQVQQMMQEAMRPKPAGIEGIPANNMQGMQRMAGGGVVGYASRGYVDPQFPEVYETSEADLNIEQMREAARRKQEEDERRRKLEFLESTGAPQAAQYREPVPVRPSVPVAPIPEGSDRRQDIPEGGIVSPGMSKAIPAPRPVARPPAAPAAPQGGIAQLAAPTPEGAMASARSTLGLGDTTSLRAKEDAYLAALKAQPAAGQQGLAALQAQQSDLQRMHEKAEKESNINSVIQQLLGRGEGAGGAARAGRAFDESENARRRTYNELQVANATKRDAIIDLQNARGVGNAKAALEAEQRVRQADLAIAKAEGDLAAHFASSQAGVYGTQVRSQDEAANRATQLQIARIQAAARNDPQSKEAMAMARVQQAINGNPLLKSLAEQAKFDPSAAARYRTEEEALYKRVAPELFGVAGAAPAAASNDPLGLRR